MWTHEELAARLPGPRQDEPPTLRQRIVAEIADHLACALHRELVRTGDAAEARRRVLERFGNPALMVRRLWFDAMWEQIMSQRILAACCVLLTAACLAGVGIAWRVSSDVIAANQRSSEGQREFAEGLKQLSAAIAQSSNASTEMSKTLSQMNAAPAAQIGPNAPTGSSSVGSPATAEELDPRLTVPLKVRVHKGRIDGPGLAEAYVQLRSHVRTDQTPAEIAVAFTDHDGVADLKRVPRDLPGATNIEVKYKFGGIQLIGVRPIRFPILEPELVIDLVCHERLPGEATITYTPSAFPGELPDPEKYATLHVFERAPWTDLPKGQFEWSWSGSLDDLPLEQKLPLLRSRGVKQFACLVDSNLNAEQVYFSVVSAPTQSMHVENGQAITTESMDLKRFPFRIRKKTWYQAYEGERYAVVSSAKNAQSQEYYGEMALAARSEGVWTRRAILLLRRHTAGLASGKLEPEPNDRVSAGGKTFSDDDVVYQIVAGTDDNGERSLGDFDISQGSYWSPRGRTQPTSADSYAIHKLRRYIAPPAGINPETVRFELKAGENPPIVLPFPAAFVDAAKQALADEKAALEKSAAAEAEAKPDPLDHALDQ